MAFEIALTGLAAAMADLNTTANNIANASTVGFKFSRAEFADMFPVSPYGLASNAIGTGVKVASVAQQFAQGDINSTGNNLDLAISGSGFFTLSSNGSTVYSRAGNFGVDKSGYVVDPSGNRLQVFPATTTVTGGVSNTTFNTGKLSDLQLATSESSPNPTSTVSLGANLPASDEPPTVTTFDPTNAQSYNETNSLTTYDSLGVAHTTNFYYVKSSTPNQWSVYTYTDGTSVSGPDSLAFDATGKLTTPTSGLLPLPPYTPTDGASPMNISVDLSGTTQYSSSYALNSLTQDGYATGNLSGVSVDSNGVVTANYTNGQSTALGQVALTNFSNAQGLQQTGGNDWVETAQSGQPLRGSAGTSAFGDIQSGALEESNVDLTAQLVNMISAQRNYQANAQVIQTSDAITQTIIQMR
ncbi:MAG TPA: flagellar hook protein FlgE [Rudaea sp.]|jgi:flagellar hook protein FlgE|nr:flagellar hook protein FlgE [Rudaea sp.]